MTPRQQYVTIQNLTQVLSAMENIVLNKMVLAPTDAESISRQFGFIFNEKFYLSSELEVKKLSEYFQPLVDTKNKALYKAARDKEQEFTKIKFEPKINNKSRKL